MLVTLISESFRRNFFSDMSMVHVRSFASRSQVSLQMNSAFWSVEILVLNIIFNIGKVKSVLANVTIFVIIRCRIKHLDLQCGVLRYREGLSYIGWENSLYQPRSFSVRFIYKVNFSFSEKTDVISEWGSGNNLCTLPQCKVWTKFSIVYLLIFFPFLYLGAL